MNKAFNMEEAIERYLNGTMSVAEKHEFMARLERDHHLRRAVDAELLIRRSVSDNRAAMPAPSRESRAKFLAMVATIAPEPSALAPAHAAAAGKSSSLLKYFAGSGLAKGLIATVAGTALTIGAIVLTPTGNDRDAAAPGNVQVIEQPQPHVAPELPSAPEQTNVADGPAPAAVSGQERETLNLNDGSHEPAARLRPTADNGSAPKQSSGTISANDGDASAQSATAPELITNRDEDQQVKERDAKDMPVITDDSVAVRFNMKKPTIKR